MDKETATIISKTISLSIQIVSPSSQDILYNDMQLDTEINRFVLRIIVT